MRTRIGIGLLAVAALASAQPATFEKHVEVIAPDGQAPAAMVYHQAGGVVGGLVSSPTVQFISAEVGMAGKLVRGAPYTADAVSETVQVLADGNRIARKTTAQIARDGEGRTRRHDKLTGLGPLPAQKAHELIFINDPVAKVGWVLEPDTKIARKMPLPPSDLKPGETAQVTMRHEAGVRIEERVVAIGTRTHTAGPDPGKTESLGRRDIEGVVAEGSRSTRTIPAGEIGNDRPIEIVAERWYSNELQLAVMTRTNDPRFGETTYRLTNILRSEPPRSLFEVPPDYQVTEMKGGVTIMKKEKP